MQYAKLIDGELVPLPSKLEEEVEIEVENEETGEKEMVKTIATTWPFPKKRAGAFGYLEVEETPPPSLPPEGGHFTYTWEEKGGKIVKTWEYHEPVIFEPTAEQKIDELEDSLAGSDYKVIKCIEAFLSGEALPYDISELHEERQAIRDQINNLEEEDEQA